MGALEGQITDNTTTFAESALVDCNRQYYNEGCNGGFPPMSFEYLFSHRIMTSEEYPYTPVDHDCQFEEAGNGLHTVRPVYQCCDSTGSVLAEWIHKKGPIAVSVHAG